MARPVWQPTYIGLGSNLDDPSAQVLGALEALADIAHSRVIMTSALYRSPPMGPADQPDYINAVAGMLTQLTPADLLLALQAIEQRQGRRRDGERWGPRTLDLDLLSYGNERSNDRALTLPHPGIAERAFVLVPLHEIAPALEIPGLGSVERLRREVSAEGLTRIDPS
jgi:2-amino-4-hydroxy-6-hydroxymethyldihydropteridine diphosphokinase